MSSVPNSYIDDLRSIVLATLNRIEQLRMRVVYGLEQLKGAFGQELIFDSDGNIVAKSFRFENLASAPAGTEKGLSYYNTATNELYVYINSGWVSIGAGGGASDHSLLSNLAWSVAGHTINTDFDLGNNEIDNCNKINMDAGFHPAAYINPVFTDPTYDLKIWGESEIMFFNGLLGSESESVSITTEHLDLHSNPIINVVNPSNAQDAATKKYVDDSDPYDIENQSFTNLLENGDFESWSAGASAAPDVWSLGGTGASVARSTDERINIYSANVTKGSVPAYLWNGIINYLYYKGRTVTAGAWVKTSTASQGRILIEDGTGNTASPHHTGNGNWEWLSVTRTIDNSATFIRLHMRVESAGSVLFDGAILVEGSVCPASSPKPLVDDGKTIAINSATNVTTFGGNVDIDGSNLIGVGTIIGNGTGDRIEIGGRLDLNGEYLEGSRIIYGQNTAVLADNTINFITYSTGGAPKDILLLNDNGVEVGDDLWMAANKIVNLGAHTANGNAVRYEHLALDEHTQYLLINGTRAMTGEFDINANHFKNMRYVYGRNTAVLANNTINFVTYSTGGTPKDIIIANDNGVEVGDDLYVDGKYIYLGDTTTTYIRQDWTDASLDSIQLYASDGVKISHQLSVAASTLIQGNLTVSGSLSKGSGSCLTTDIFYNSSKIDIIRGMVCISTGDSIGDRIYSKPISSVEPCSIENDKRVMGVKVVEDITHTEVTDEMYNTLLSNAKGLEPSTYNNPLRNASYGDLYEDEGDYIFNHDLSPIEYEVMSQISISKFNERLHIGILGQYSKVLVDADINPIENGDLLTTSTTIGHGMKSIDRVAGTMFGKALQDKPNGKGYIRVLLYNS